MGVYRLDLEEVSKWRGIGLHSIVIIIAASGVGRLVGFCFRVKGGGR